MLVSKGRYEQVSDEMMHALHISDVTAEDAGTFTAVASNCLGTASHSAKLSVDSMPSWKRPRYSPANGVAVLRQQEPSLRRSPRSSEAEQAVTSSHLKMMPGCIMLSSLFTAGMCSNHSSSFNSNFFNNRFPMRYSNAPPNEVLCAKKFAKYSL